MDTFWQSPQMNQNSATYQKRSLYQKQVQSIASDTQTKN